MKKILLILATALYTINLHAQKEEKELIGEYKYYTVIEDSVLAFNADNATNPIGKTMDEAIRKSYLKITPDSLLFIDEKGKRKGVSYLKGKADRELLIKDKGVESNARYYFEGDKLYLYFKEGESNMEFILTRK